ncbi:MAG TPA: PqqD family protein [Gemmatimonadales bacterium]|nr:PqqD family protein [Gemmatimonadales bacterium]
MPAIPSRRRAPRARPDLVFRPAGDAWILADPTGAPAQVLSFTTALIWSYCDGHHDFGAIAEAIAPALPSRPDPAAIRAQVRAAIDAWNSAGLLS